MPDEWVVTHLRNYCPPGRHTFIGIAIGATERIILRCSTCDKEEVRGSTCLICTMHGRAEVRMVFERSGEAVAGKLCDVCADEFGRLGSIEGWCVESAQAGRDQAGDAGL